ncbi:MAG: DinB superfamily [Chloroflexota bacterium]|jgi:hypothetical protein
MKELMEYREKLLARLSAAEEEFCEACRSFANPFASVDGEWTVHQVAFHVGGIHREVYGARVLRTFHEENPLIKNFEPEEWMVAIYSREEPLENILTEFSTSIQAICVLLGNAPQESWSRLSQHEALGKELTLQLWAERGLAHIEDHLKSLKKAQNP